MCKIIVLIITILVNKELQKNLINPRKKVDSFCRGRKRSK